MKVKKQKFRESDLMNPLRRNNNRIILPLSVAIFVICISVGYILMETDEDKYLIAFLCLLVFGCLPVFAQLPLMPVLRRKETEIEMSKYDFDLTNVEEKESYNYFRRFVDFRFETSLSPFEEAESTLRGTGLRELNEKLTPFLSDDFKQIPLEQKPEFFDFELIDFSEEAHHVPFEITSRQISDDKREVTVSEIHELSFTSDGVTVNEKLYPYSEMKGRIETSTPLFTVRVYLVLEIHEELYTHIRLDGKLLRIIDRFSLPIENRAELDYIVAHKQQAFYQILKYGKIKKII